MSNVWYVLTSDHILIHSIKHYTFTKVANDGNLVEDWHTSWATSYRTFNSDEHDFLTVKSEAIRKYKTLPDHLKADNVL